MKGKHSGHKSRYMEKLSGKQWLRQEKIGGHG